MNIDQRIQQRRAEIAELTAQMGQNQMSEAEIKQMETLQKQLAPLEAKADMYRFLEIERRHIEGMVKEIDNS